MIKSKLDIESRILNSTLLASSTLPPDVRLITSLTKIASKNLIEDIIKKIQSKKFKVFKTDRIDDFSLTMHGFIALIDIKLYPAIYNDIMTKEECTTPNILNILNKIMLKPYFIGGTTVFYFDDLIEAQKNFYGSLIQMIEAYKKDIT